MSLLQYTVLVPRIFFWYPGGGLKAPPSAGIAAAAATAGAAGAAGAGAASGAGDVDGLLVATCCDGSDAQPAMAAATSSRHIARMQKAF